MAKVRWLFEEPAASAPAAPAAAPSAQPQDEQKSVEGDFWIALSRLKGLVDKQTPESLRDNSDKITDQIRNMFTGMEKEPVVGKIVRQLEYFAHQGNLEGIKKTLQSASGLYKNPFEEVPNYYIYRGQKQVGPYTKGQVLDLWKNGKLTQGDVVFDRSSNLSKVYNGARSASGSAKDERILQTKPQSFAKDADAWEYVYNAARALLDRYYYASDAGVTPTDLTKVFRQISAIKKVAGKWLNDRETTKAVEPDAAEAPKSESIVRAEEAITELASIDEYLTNVISERYGIARRQARLIRLQTRQLLDAQRDDQKQEVARGPFIDTVRAEEEGSEDEDKDK